MKLGYWFRVACTLIAWLPVGAQAAIVLALAPASVEPRVGESVVLEVRVSGLGDGAAPSLGAFDIDIAFDTNVLQLESVFFGTAAGNPLAISGLPPVTSWFVLPGLLNLAEVSTDPAGVLDADQAADIVLATLGFRVLAEGTSEVVPTINALGDAAGDPLVAEALHGARVTATVAEPASLWLAGLAALAALGVFGPRRLPPFATGRQGRWPPETA